jgi:ParB family chromosome partitioning protein
VVELDPEICDPSAIADRVPDTTDAAFDAFVEQISDPCAMMSSVSLNGRTMARSGRPRRRAARCRRRSGDLRPVRDRRPRA